MSFQSSKINPETVLRFPGGVSAAQILSPQVLSSQVLSSHVAPSSAKALLPVLIVLHQETSSPGRVGNVLRALGHRLDIRRPRFGDPASRNAGWHAGAVIFGGPMSANDPDDFVRREIDWIAVPLRGSGRSWEFAWARRCSPCSSARGVAPHPEGRAQIGYYPIRPTPAGLVICPDWPDRVYHWHREGLNFPLMPNCWPRQRFPGGSVPDRALFRLPVSSRCDLRDDASLDHARHARLELPGARARHHHFADRAGP